MIVVPHFTPMAGWLALVHRAYGRWDVLLWAQWFDAWRIHIEDAESAGRITPSRFGQLWQWAFNQCPRFDQPREVSTRLSLEDMGFVGYDTLEVTTLVKAA